jgi:hypothetical protein
MSVQKEILYFNSFLLKKYISTDIYKTLDYDGNLSEEPSGNIASWPGIPGNSPYMPKFPLYGEGVTILNSYTPPKNYLFNWYVEESRIRGGYNNTTVDFGVKAFIIETEDTELILGNGIIYSGLYNSRSGFNQTNVFSTGENITKEVDPRYGNIQKLYTTDTNLIIFQEDKVSNVLVDKDAIYTADGNPALTATQLVLGQVSQYSGEYGISENPESFSFKGYRIYFSDKNRGAIMRLSRDGLTEISRYGMRDYFRDTLANISEQFKPTKNILIGAIPALGEPTTTDTFTVTGNLENSVSNLEIGMASSQPFYNTSGLYILNIFNIDLISNTANITINKSVDTTSSGSNIFSFFKFVKDKVVGAYDNFYDKYVVSMQQTDLETYNTVSFNDSNNGWTSLWDYDPSFGGTLNNIYYTTKGGSIWKHYDESVINNRGTFYGTYYPTSVTLSFNPMVSVSKNFNTVNYEGTNGWQADFFLSDPTGNLQGINYKDESSFVYSYDEGSYTESGVTYRVGFNIKDNKYFANLVNKGVQANGNNTIAFGMPGQVVPGASMSGIKGFFATVKLSTDDTTDLGGAKNLFAVSSNFVKS